MSEIIITVPSANIQVSSTAEPVEVTADSLAVTVSSNNYTVTVPSVTENITVSSNAVIHEVEFKTTVSESEPAFAAEGEQWYNPSNTVLSVFSDGEWSPVGADDLFF